MGFESLGVYIKNIICFSIYQSPNTRELLHSPPKTSNITFAYRKLNY